MVWYGAFSLKKHDRQTDGQWQIQIKGLWRFRLFALEPIVVFIPLIQLKGCVDHMYSQYLSEYIDQSIPTAIG